MTKKEKVNQIMSYYDHRDANNEFITPEGRKYHFPTLPEFDYRGRTAREQIEKMVDSSMKESKPTYDHKATPSSWFLSEMQHYKNELKELISTEKMKVRFYEELRKSIFRRKEYKGGRGYCDLRYEDFEWACLTIPRAWLR